MDGFQTFASSRGGACFSAVGLAVVSSFSLAAMLQVRKIPAANASSGALHLEESFMPERLSNSDARCQACPGICTLTSEPISAFLSHPRLARRRIRLSTFQRLFY